MKFNSLEEYEAHLRAEQDKMTVPDYFYVGFSILVILALMVGAYLDMYKGH